MSKLDLIDAIKLELKGMNLPRLENVLKYCRTQNAKQVALHHEFQDAPPTTPKPKRQRKTGTFREVRTIRNRSKAGKTYQWEYDVTYEDGKRIKSKSIGRVK